jgi:hypothetical protein
MDAPYFLSLTQLGFGQMLFARGQKGDASRGDSLLRSAGDLTSRYGYTQVERRVDDALAQLG